MTLPFDPIDEAARQWGNHWGRVPAMHAVTSLMRVQQLVIGRLDALLKPHGLTFARYEALVLLVFSSRGSLPLGKMGERLQVHPTSVTSIVRRLESAGLVVRTPHPDDGRAVLAEITPAGRELVEGFAGGASDRNESAAVTTLHLHGSACDLLVGDLVLGLTVLTDELHARRAPGVRAARGSIARGPRRIERES